MNTTRLLLASLVIGHSSLVISSVAAAATDDASLRPVAFQNGVNQQALGAETAALAREIDSLIEELQRNGFPVQSLSALTELAAQLNELGGTEMTAIAQRLRKLGESAQADPRATATEAYQAQQAIESRLKTLARQISIQQLREETARRLEALINRQLSIQRETRAIASAKPANERQRLLEIDQSGIGEDLQTFFQTGENLLSRLREQNTPAGAAPVPESTFAERINGPLLTTLSNEALEEVKGKRYPTAYGRQDSLVVELRKILQGILSSLPKEQRLASALQQVSALRQQEEANRQAQNTPNQQTAQDAADQAQNLANQVAPLSPEAAAALNKAREELQKQANAAQQTPPQNQQQSNQQKSNAQQQASQQQQQQQQQQNAQNKNGQEKNGQDQNARQQPQLPPPPSTTAEALAQAEAALQKALAQAQQAQSPNNTADSRQQSGQQQNGQQQAGNNQQQRGQQQNQQTAQQGGQQQQQQQQQNNPNGQQTAQAGADGRSPDQQGGINHNDASMGGTQHQIAGHGPDSSAPAQVVGALRPGEREAFTALQGERYPAEYSAWVQQYWRNLAQDQ